MVSIKRDCRWIFIPLKSGPWVTHTPPFEETDLYDDEILMKGRRWGGLSEFQDPGVGALVIFGQLYWGK